MGLTSTQKTETNTVELEIAVGAKELKSAVENVFRRKVKTLSVPGFRKGKAPRGVIEKMYGEGVFLEDAVNELCPDAYEAAVEEAGIEPVDRAKMEILSLSKEEGFTFKATVTVKPEVTVKNYKGVEAEKEDSAVDGAEVYAEIERVRERNARLVTVEGRAAQDGDTAVIDYEGFVDDVPFEGGKGENHPLVLGSGRFIPGFEEQVAGHSAGEEFDVKVTFPEEYHAEELKGKSAVFKVKLHELQAKELPELDDEFAKDVSEFDTLEEYRNDLAAKMFEQKSQAVERDFENAVLDAVLENLEGEIPECMYESLVDDMMRDFEYRISMQGMRLEQYLSYTGMDRNAFRNGFRAQAERQVKVRLALEKIAELEGLEVSEEEVAEELRKLAESYGTDVEKLREMMPEKEIINDVKCTKAVEFLRENAVVKQKPSEGADGQEQ